MSEFLIDHRGFTIWYDLKSTEWSIGSLLRTVHHDHKKFYVRPHCEDGPAILYPNGLETYCIKGKLHRDDGPAVIKVNKYMKWYCDNQLYSFHDWCIRTKKSNEEITFLRLKWNVNNIHTQ